MPSPADLLRLTEVFVRLGALGDYQAAGQFWAGGGRERFVEPPEVRRLFEEPGVVPNDALPRAATILVGSVLPYQHNPLFTGRVAEMRALVAACDAATTVAITGIAGVGKSQLAIEFAHRHGPRFPGGIFWLSFADPPAIPAEVAACGGAGRLNLRPDFHTLPLSEQIHMVQAAWQSPLPRLLIFDNCEDELLLATWRPNSGGCHVLITSRRARWSVALGVHVLALAPLQRSESVAFLNRFLHTSPVPQESWRSSLDVIAAELGDLPLALHLAGGFIERYGSIVTAESYLAGLRAAPFRQLTPDRASAPGGYRPDVAASFALSYDRLSPDDPTDALALTLLRHAACFAPGESIPRDLILASLELTGTDLDSALRSADALARLTNLGLLQSGDQGDVRLHRLLCMFVADIGNLDEARAAVERILIAEARQLAEVRNVAQMLAIQGHLRAICEHATDTERAVTLFLLLGWHLTILYDWEEAWRAFERAQKLCSISLGSAGLVRVLNSIGLLLMFQGRYVEAAPLLRRALASCSCSEESLDTEALDVCTNLGYLLGLQGNYQEGLALLRRALIGRRQRGGSRDPETARVVSHIGFILYQQGRRASALRFLRLALRMREQIVSAPHAAIAQSLNNLGEVLLSVGDLSAARRTHERALAMRRALFGENHAHTAESLKNLGVVCAAEGDPAGGRMLLEQAEAIFESRSGPRNVDTAWCIEQLGHVCLALGDHPTARRRFQAALAVYQQQFLADHPWTRRALAALATIEMPPA